MNTKLTHLHTGMRRACHGLSLIELMVGLSLGLFILTTALTVLEHHLRDTRGLVLEARLAQDLRVAVDMMARQLRRSGYWGLPHTGVWQAGTTSTVNPYLAVTPDHAASDAVQFHYSRDNQENQRVDSHDQLGFRLRKGVIEARLGHGGWQALTDPAVMEVTDLQLKPLVQTQRLPELCHRPCTSTSDSCPPRHLVRQIGISVRAHAVHDVHLERRLDTQVRLRNDAVLGQCPT